MKNSNKLINAALAVLLSAVSSGVIAAVIKIPEGAFTPAAGLITFSEKPFGTVNPVYAPGDYGGGGGAPTVSFGGFFAGQALGGASPPCPPGAALSGCVIGTPTGPLALAAGAPNAFITNDGAQPNTPVLSGTPLFNGPIAMLFSVDVFGVGLMGGFFNAVGSTAITAFDRNGNILGSVTNTVTGIEFLGLVTDDGTASIAGLLFHLVGAEPAGFTIDDVRFGQPGQIIVPGGVPEPATLLLLGAALVGLGAMRRRQR